MFSDSPYYKEAIHFCHEYDQNCFDPAYDSEPLEFFIPMIESFFSSPKTDDVEALARYGKRA